jgi:uncharacterized damage-inducible protein DinB
LAGRELASDGRSFSAGSFINQANKRKLSIQIKGAYMSIESLIDTWTEVRKGFIAEAEQVPADQFSFRATPDTRSVAELLQHIIETQQVLTGEACRAEPNLMRQLFADHIKEYAPDVAATTDKDGLLALMRSSMDKAEATIRANEDMLADTIKRFDGREMTKLDFLRFASSHEMYHRGQFTVYERLLNIKPALTAKFEKLFAQSRAQAAE